MRGPFFLDTDIFVYAFDSRDRRKQRRALQLLEAAQSGQGVISYQIVQEFLSVCVTKNPAPMTIDEAQAFLEEALMPMVRVYPNVSLYTEALEIRRETQWQFFDCLVVAGAVQAGCSVLYTEDLNHNRMIRGVRITNPFHNSLN